MTGTKREKGPIGADETHVMTPVQPFRRNPGTTGTPHFLDSLHTNPADTLLLAVLLLLCRWRWRGNLEVL